MQTDVDGVFSELVAAQTARTKNQQAPGDEKLIVVFREDAILDQGASDAAGMPKYRMADIVSIWVPGDRFSKIDREVTEIDKRRFKEKYEAFKAGHKPVESGHPLEMWAPISKAMVLELRYHNVRTVEQLANLSDGNMQNIGPLHSLKQKAIDFLASIKDTETVVKLRTEVEKRDNEIDSLKKALEQMNRKIDELSKTSRK